MRSPFIMRQSSGVPCDIIVLIVLIGPEILPAYKNFAQTSSRTLPELVTAGETLASATPGTTETGIVHLVERLCV